MMTTPLIHYPTTLYWVDDDALFLEIAIEGFSDKYQIKSASSPKEAVTFFENYHQHINALTLLRSCIDHEDYDLNDHHPVDIAFDVLRSIKDDPRKTEDVSVIIVDYMMPGMSGFELCKALQNIPAKKILLTGTADYQEAVRMLNQGIIHAFIRKDDPNIGQSLAINIDKLNSNYFIEQTQPILTHLQSGHLLPQTDPVFIEFFQKIIAEYDVREYYLADKNGSMILVDIRHQIRYLIIHTDRTLHNFIDLHEGTENAGAFVEEIKKLSRLPFFSPDQESWKVDVGEWGENFYQPNVLKGREHYYWMILSKSL